MSLITKSTGNLTLHLYIYLCTVKSHKCQDCKYHPTLKRGIYLEKFNSPFPQRNLEELCLALKKIIHLFLNMTKLKFTPHFLQGSMRIAFSSMASKPITIQYPLDQNRFSARLKNHVQQFSTNMKIKIIKLIPIFLRTGLRG